MQLIEKGCLMYISNSKKISEEELDRKLEQKIIAQIKKRKINVFPLSGTKKMKTFNLATNIKKGGLKQMVRKNIEYGELDYNYKQNGFLFHDIDELRNFSNFNDDVEESI